MTCARGGIRTSRRSPQLVTGGTFGQLWSASVEGQVYAQPLLDDGTLFVATEQNNIYGLDPSSGKQLWSKSLGTPWNPGEISCADLSPDVGVTATPVIDPATNLAYFTYKTYVSGDSGAVRWYMDAVSVSNGDTASGFPQELAGVAQNAPEVKFEPTTQLQRPGLLLMKGVVYAAFGSDCDTSPWDGWVFGVSTSGEVKARWVTDETENGAGIWQSGAGLTSDGEGRILLSTGNGGAPETPAPGTSPPANLGESVVQLEVQPDGSLKAVDFFAPYDAASLDTWDADFASGGVTGLPDEYFGTSSTSSLAVAVGKDGYVYLLNREDLGGIGQGPGGSDDVVQRIGPYGGVWSRPGVWPGEGGWVYIPTASGGESGSGSSGYLRVLGLFARIQLRALRLRHPGTLAPGYLHRGTVRFLLQRAGDHLQWHRARVRARVDRVGAQRLRGRRAATRLLSETERRPTRTGLERAGRHFGEVRDPGRGGGTALRRHARWPRACLRLSGDADALGLGERIPDHDCRRQTQ